MARDLFGSIVNDSSAYGTRKGYTVPLSIAAHIAALLGLVITPLVASGLLPTPESVLVFAAPPPSPPPPPPPEAPRPEVAPPPTDVIVNRDAAPVEAPQRIVDEPPRPQSFSTARGVDGGVPSSFASPTTTLAPPPPPPAERPLFVRPGGAIKEPRKVHDVKPIYPPIAVAAKVSGYVIIEATIDKEGNVREAVVLRSHPMLDQAALDAVRDWKFTPTTLNGEPIDLKMTVTVNFSLR